MSSKSSMKRLRMLLGTFLVFLVSIPTARAQVNAKAVACPSNPSVSGYTSIADINQDQFDELARITAGSVQPSPPYSFVLCPNTQFDASNHTLNIVLSGTVISCGNDMYPSNSLGCSFRGGRSQVYLADSTTPGYELASATLIGVTFEMFNGTSIDVMATETFTLTLMDVVWKNFFSDFVIRQQQPVEGTWPARVDLVGGVIDNGMGGSLFSNEGGVLGLDRLTVANVTCAGLVSASNGGVVMMQSSMISRSVIDTVVSAMMGSALSITDVDVFDMIFTKTVFQASNAGTKLLMRRTKIRDINNAGEWKGVVVDDSADAKLEQVQFNSNGRFRSLVDGHVSASIQMIDCVFDGNFGVSPMSFSTVVYAVVNSVVTMSRTKFTGNTQLTAIVFASMQSALTIQQSCFIGGSSDEVVFRSSDSATTVSENFVANVGSTTCPAGWVRLSVEQAGSQCYQRGGTSCVSSCDILGDQASCVADMVLLAPEGRQANGTMAPGTNGTVAPTAADGNMTTMPPAPPAPDAPGGNVTPPVPGENETIIPTVPGGTTPPTEDVDMITRIYVAWEVSNDMMITDPENINASGLGEAFPVYAERVVANLSATVRRQLLLHQRRRLEISLVPGSAEVYEIIPVGCVSDDLNRTSESNMTTSNASTTCHEAMGKYDLLLTSDEDAVAVRTTYTRATRAGIDDSTFQDVLLEVDPDSPLIVGPSIDARPPETDAPTQSGDSPAPSQPVGGPPTLFPSASKPLCPPGTSKRSKSKSKAKPKGAKGMMGKSKASKSVMKMMRKHRRHGGGGTNHHQHPHTHRAGYGRNLAGHDAEVDQGHITPEFAIGVDEDEKTMNFANVLKEHDGDGSANYYRVHEEEEEEEEEEEIDADECVEEEDYYYGARSKGSKGTSGGYYDEERTVADTVNGKEHHHTVNGEEMTHHHAVNGEEPHHHTVDDYEWHGHRRHLLEDSGLPRIHGAHHRSHRISNMRDVVAAELEDSEHAGTDRYQLRNRVQ